MGKLTSAGQIISELNFDVSKDELTDENLSLINFTLKTHERAKRRIAESPMNKVLDEYLAFKKLAS